MENDVTVEKPMVAGLNKYWKMRIGQYDKK